jgi:hypothetical protein
VTIAKRPFVWAGMAKDMQVIWVRREWKYFFEEDWTTQISLNCFNKFVLAITLSKDELSDVCGVTTTPHGEEALLRRLEP